MVTTPHSARSAQPGANTPRTGASAAYRSPSNPTASSGSATTMAAAGTMPSAGAGLAGSTRDMATGLGELTEAHAELMQERGLDLEMLWKVGVESVATRMPGQWVRYPYLVAGKTVNHKYRRLDEKDFRQDPAGTKCLWNFDCLADPSLAAEPLIITEGEDDCIVLMQCGFQRVVSVPDGAPKEQLGGGDEGRKYGYMLHAAEALKLCERVILATDSDQQGLNLRADLALRFGRPKCQYLDLGGHKDIRALFLAEGPDAVRAAVGSARWMRVTGLFLMSELPPVADPKSYEIGLAGMAAHYRIRRGDFCVLTGIPGMGKTAIVNDIACRMARRHRWRTCFASFEQYPQIDHRRALRTWVNSKPEADQSPGELEIADEFIDEWFSFMVPPDDEDATLPWILERAAASVVRYETDMLVIDPWNEMDHARPHGMLMTEYVGSAIKEMKRFAREMNIHLIVAAHPTKMSRDKEGNVPVPSLYDISDSAMWSNKADVGLIVHRETETKTLVRIAKSRYHDKIGKPGEVHLQFIPYTGKFEAA